MRIHVCWRAIAHPGARHSARPLRRRRSYRGLTGTSPTVSYASRIALSRRTSTWARSQVELFHAASLAHTRLITLQGDSPAPLFAPLLSSAGIRVLLLCDVVVLSKKPMDVIGVAELLAWELNIGMRLNTIDVCPEMPVDDLHSGIVRILNSYLGAVNVRTLMTTIGQARVLAFKE